MIFLADRRSVAYARPPRERCGKRIISEYSEGQTGGQRFFLLFTRYLKRAAYIVKMVKMGAKYG